MLFINLDDFANLSYSGGNTAYSRILNGANAKTIQSKLQNFSVYPHYKFLSLILIVLWPPFLMT